MGSKKVVMSMASALLSTLSTLTASTSLPTKEAPSAKAYKVQPVGAGYYALQHNMSNGGEVYSKLVVRDKSRALPRAEVKFNTKVAKMQSAEKQSVPTNTAGRGR